MKPRKEDSLKQQIDKEIAIIDLLLRDEAFAVTIAEAQHKAYYVGVGETPPPFLAPGQDTAGVKIKARHEKIATNLAGFYALECGLGAVCAQTNQKPTDFLQMIVENKVDPSTVLLLNWFANTIWKAGQSFRGLARIKRPMFRVASWLPEDTIKKDYKQICIAATKLLASMLDVRNGSMEEQMALLRSLLQDEHYAIEMATFINASCGNSSKESVSSLLSPDDEKAISTKSVKEQIIATNVVGLYELEGGLSYLVTTEQKRPSDILKAIVSDTVGKQNKELLCRFANAGWKASQPFRGLDRITRSPFTPFYFLTEAEIDKDWVQIKAAASVVLTKV